MPIQSDLISLLLHKRKIGAREKPLIVLFYCEPARMADVPPIACSRPLAALKLSAKRQQYKMKGKIYMIMPYLNFAGDCEEAFRLYQRAFGGQEPIMARYSDAPESAYPDMEQEQKNKIMHGHIMLTEAGGVSGADAIWPF